MTTQFETREFRTSSRHMNGKELIEIIKAHDLQDYVLHSVSTESGYNHGSLVNTGPTYVVVFRRRVE